MSAGAQEPRASTPCLPAPGHVPQHLCQPGVSQSRALPVLQGCPRLWSPPTPPEPHDLSSSSPITTATTARPGQLGGEETPPLGPPWEWGWPQPKDTAAAHPSPSLQSCWSSTPTCPWPGTASAGVTPVHPRGHLHPEEQLGQHSLHRCAHLHHTHSCVHTHTLHTQLHTHVHICTYTCPHTCTYMYTTHTHMHVCTTYIHTCAHTYTTHTAAHTHHTHTCVHTHICALTYTAHRAAHTFTCVHTHTRVCAHTYTTHMDLHTHVHICTYMCTHTCTHTHVYTHTGTHCPQLPGGSCSFLVSSGMKVLTAAWPDLQDGLGGKGPLNVPWPSPLQGAGILAPDQAAQSTLSVSRDGAPAAFPGSPCQYLTALSKETPLQTPQSSHGARPWL